MENLKSTPHTSSFIKYVSISVCVGFTAFIIGTAIGKEKTVNLDMYLF